MNKAVPQIVLEPSPSLLIPSAPVLVFDEDFVQEPAERLPEGPVCRRSLHELVADMRSAMWMAGGIGLAAVQIGVPLQVLIIEKDGQVIPMVNPEIIGRGATCEVTEGCLSIPGRTFLTTRYRSVTVMFRGLLGNQDRIDLYGLPAIVFQHEYDHLNGQILSHWAKPVDIVAEGL